MLKRERDWHLEARAKIQRLSTSVVIILEKLRGKDEEKVCSFFESLKRGGRRLVYIETKPVKK